MPTYKSLSGGLHFIDDDRFIYLLPSGSVEITEAEATAARAPTAAQLWAEYQGKALLELNKSDMVALRCFKAAVVFPVAWVTYVTALRAIVGTASGDSTKPLPTIPTYPTGT